MTMIRFSDLYDAFLFVSSAGYGLHTVVLNKATGKFYYRSEMGDIDEISDDDLDFDSCISIPHKNDLGLGNELVYEFISDHLPDEYDFVRHIFSKRGAYSRFKDLLESKDLLQNWYDFEQKREEEELRQWCDENAIQLSG
jgi:hypothetical protein